MRGAVSVALAASALLAVALPASAAAEFGFAAPPELKILDSVGKPYAVAGGHPDRLQLTVKFATAQRELNGKPTEVVDANPKDMEIDFPPGFAGDPKATPTCPRAAFDRVGAECSPASQVGIANIRLVPDEGGAPSTNAIYNIEPAPGRMAEFGMSLLGRSVLFLRLRPDDYGLRIEQRDLTQFVALKSLEVDLWGVPADHQEGTEIPRKPLLTLPSRCDRGPVQVTVRLRSWQEPGRWASATTDAESPLSGCRELDFSPALSFDLGSRETDSPTSATVGLTMPQDAGPDGRASAPLRRLKVALPPGLAVSPGVASGLTLCPEAALARGTDAAASCPPSSRVGTVRVEAGSLPAPLEGKVFLGESRPGERFRLFVVADGSGVSAKLIGTLQADPATGQLTAVLDDLPELPLERIELAFDGGPRALLATPLTCGPTSAAGTFEPYGGSQVVSAGDAVSVDRGPGGAPCALPLLFAPAFEAGTLDNRAGRATALTLTLHRRSGEQLPDRFATVLPPGLTAAPAALARCPEADAATGACGPGSRVGSVVAEVGSGTSLARLDGDAYLTGAYRGAPFGLALVLRGALGPFDLGNTVVRAALRLDPETGRVSVATDALPRVVEGVPIRFRTIGLDIDRRGFIRTPTSCAPGSIDATVRSVAGGSATVSAPYFVRGCEKLRFRPGFSMRLTGRGQLHRSGRPGILIAVHSQRGGANLRAADIALPDFLRQSGSPPAAICARGDAAAGNCPGAARVGRAHGVTSLVDRPLSGPLYIVQPPDSGAPDIWVDLEAEGVSMRVRGELRIDHGRVYTKLVDLPDAPIERLSLFLRGGEHGLIAYAADPCSRRERRRRARAAFEGQNRAYTIARRPVARPKCG